ncbi:MAG: glycosyltransferase family 4 protein [Alsobacter sp.]
MTPEIIQVIQEFSRAGGAETVALELAVAFDAMGLSNAVIAGRVGEGLDKERRIQRIAPWMARIGIRGAMRHLGRLLVIPCFTIGATFAARRHKDKVVISHGDVLAGDILVVHAVNAANLAEKRRERDWRWLANPIHLWVALRDRFMIGGLRYRRYVALSPRVRHDLQAHYGVPSDRIATIPNGIDTTRYRRDPEAGAAIRKALDIPATARVLLFVGHEFPRKGLEFVMRAMPDLPQDVWLLVVGSDDPTPYERMAGPATERVVFLGSRSDLPALYSAANAFVLPTAYETFSLVCMEAMACGLPVVSTRVGGIEDYLVDGVNGCFVERDPAVVAARLREMLDDPALCARMAEAALRTAGDYDWSRIALRYKALIEEVALEKRMTGAARPAAGLLQTDGGGG